VALDRSIRAWLVTFPVLAMSACRDDDAPEPPAVATDDADSPPPQFTSDGGGPIVYKVDCPIGTTIEVEDNDAPERGNDLDGLSYCGAISPGSDVDYSRFVTPQGKKLALFQAVIDGQVAFDLVVNGKTLKPSDVKAFEAGEHVVKAYTTDGKPGKYRYRIQFEQ
jgi:hypothetical protein